jgi:hypothetical protein
LPEVGPDGQARIGAATVAVVGKLAGPLVNGDLACETAARCLAAAGVGRLRLLGRRPPEPAIVAALRASNPELALEQAAAWPSDGAAWMAELAGCAAVVRSGFDDDAMLRAAVRLAVPAVVVRGRGDAVDVVSFRRHGPCPHTPLEVPEQDAERDGPDGDGDGAGVTLAAAAAVVAGTLGAAEALAVIAGAATGQARARHVRVTFAGGEGRAPDLAQDIPWTPECFACGGTGGEWVSA